MTSLDGFETLAIHAGQEPDPMTGAVVPPIYQVSTFKQDGVGGTRGGYEYARTANPTRTALEQCLTALEGGAAALKDHGLPTEYAAILIDVPCSNFSRMTTKAPARTTTAGRIHTSCRRPHRVRAGTAAGRSSRLECGSSLKAAIPTATARRTCVLRTASRRRRRQRPAPPSRRRRMPGI